MNSWAILLVISIREIVQKSLVNMLLFDRIGVSVWPVGIGDEEIKFINFSRVSLL